MTKYVTQGEREMVETVVAGTVVCECTEAITEVGTSGVYIGRPAADRNGLVIYRTNEGLSDQPVAISARADGVATGRGIDFVDDDVMSRGIPLATQDWVLTHTRVFASDWLVASDTVVGSVLFENVGEREFEYQPRDGVQVTFYPKTSSQNLPMPWSVIQQRIVGYGTTGPRIQVRCIADDGTKTPFVAVVTNQAS